LKKCRFHRLSGSEAGGFAEELGLAAGELDLGATARADFDAVAEPRLDGFDGCKLPAKHASEREFLRLAK